MELGREAEGVRGGSGADAVSEGIIGICLYDGACFIDEGGDVSSGVRDVELGAIAQQRCLRASGGAGGMHSAVHFH